MHQASPNTINILMVDASVLIYKGLQWILNENFKNAKVFFSVNEKTTLEILNTISIDLIIVERDISMDYLNLISSKIRSKQLNTKIAMVWMEL